MWTALDLLARLLCGGAFVLVGWFLYQISREPVARPCVSCGANLSQYDIANCYRCLFTAVSDV